MYSILGMVLVGNAVDYSPLCDTTVLLCHRATVLMTDMSTAVRVRLYTVLDLVLVV